MHIVTFEKDGMVFSSNFSSREIEYWKLVNNLIDDLLCTAFLKETWRCEKKCLVWFAILVRKAYNQFMIYSRIITAKIGIICFKFKFRIHYRKNTILNSEKVCPHMPTKGSQLIFLYSSSLTPTWNFQKVSHIFTHFQNRYFFKRVKNLRDIIFWR